MTDMETPKPEHKGYGSRLKEMTAVLRKHEITQGLTPEKLRLILEDLGPTYIKLGQIMSLHSDILPKRYCDELMRLRSNVAPMPFSQVQEVLLASLGLSWKEIFSEIEETPLGSASIAQVHRAVLKTGEQVVIKVQRKGIYDIMARDISLLHKAVKLVPPVSLKEMVDFDMVLDELWMVTQEEMNFLKEASNMEEFARRNKEVAFVETPLLYHEFTTAHVLVMEYIDGFEIDDREALQKEGYHLDEIGSKLVDNYIRQVMEDGFFHADPHPGNIRIRDGKIVWIDMGMMGRLSDRDKELISHAIQGIAVNDIGMIQDAVLSLGEFRGKPDQSKLYEDIRTLMVKYGHLDMGDIDIAKIMQELMEVMKVNKISMPHGLTMLARGLTHMEGVLADICPEINMVEIAAARVKNHMLQHFDWKKELKTNGKILYRSLHKAIELPSLISEILQSYQKGQTKVNLDLHAGRDLSELLRRLVRNIVMGLWVMALLISSSIICTTDMSPRILGIPALGAFGYLFAFIIVVYVFLKHFLSGK
ncbi:MAG: AarF/UbiB family protein [Lachnospiraceae bacterium]|nr:AarF/UbiB family protein [Lachnospiraceae bacterium]